MSVNVVKVIADLYPSIQQVTRSALYRWRTGNNKPMPCMETHNLKTRTWQNAGRQSGKIVAQERVLS